VEAITEQLAHSIDEQKRREAARTAKLAESAWKQHPHLKEANDRFFF